MAQRFVILDHVPPQSDHAVDIRCRERHFDLMFEIDEASPLRTYATAEIELDADSSTTLERINDHDRKYLNYEGPISRNRGTVSRIAFGSWNEPGSQKLELHFDVKSPSFCSESWQLELTVSADQDHSESVSSDDSDSGCFSADVGRFLSLKRLL